VTYDPIGAYEDEIVETISELGKRERAARAERERRALLAAYYERSTPPREGP
jgi:hypothetical protein